LHVFNHGQFSSACRLLAIFLSGAAEEGQHSSGGETANPHGEDDCDVTVPSWVCCPLLAFEEISLELSGKNRVHRLPEQRIDWLLRNKESVGFSH
jgi:hypothetical protein